MQIFLERINQKQERLNEVSELQKRIGTYSKTKNIYAEYIKSGYNKNFFSEHENDINLHKSVKKYFDDLGYGKEKKLPTMQSLKQEYATVLAEKKTLYSDYNQAKSNMQNLINAKTNTGNFLGRSSNKKSSRER